MPHKPKFPVLPTLPVRLRSEFEILYDDYGGPLPLDSLMEKSSLQWACQELHFSLCWKAYVEWVPDKLKAKRIWPWVAYAASQYRFQRSEKAGYDDEPTPLAIMQMLVGIAEDARKLTDRLLQIQTLANRLPDIKAPFRRGHIAALHELIAQNLLSSRKQIDERPMAELAAHFAMRDFLRHLIRVEMSAQLAAGNLDRTLLQRARGQDDRGLGLLVAWTATTWPAIYGKAPSVARSTKSEKGNPLPGDDKPPFARFVTNVAKLVCEREPTLAEIQTAFTLVPRPLRKKHPQL